jgi:hypothetical protein
MGVDQSEPGVTACRWCGAVHGPLCPAVKAFEFQYAEGGEQQLVRVEFFAPIDYPPRKPDVAAGDDYPKLKGTRDGS